MPSSMLVMQGAPGRLLVKRVVTACSLPMAGASSGVVCTHLGEAAVLLGNIARPKRSFPALAVVSLFSASTAISQRVFPMMELDVIEQERSNTITRLEVQSAA